MTIIVNTNRCCTCTCTCTCTNRRCNNNSNFLRKLKPIRINVSVSLLLLLVSLLLLSSFSAVVAFHINNYKVIQTTTTTTTTAALSTKRWRNKQQIIVPSKKSCLVLSSSSSTTNNNNKNNQILLPMYGSGKDPIRLKKNVAILGCGGYTGALVFGYLQRCLSLCSSTGIKNIRAVGATADTSIRLNRFLSSKFCLAYANEMYLKLLNLYDIKHNSITKNLEGYDAIVFGFDNLFIQQRPVTPGTYDITPNDKTWELYWGSPQGSLYGNNDNDTNIENNNIEIQQTIISNIITSAQQANIKHAFVLVANDGNESTLQSNPTYIQLLQSKIPYTIICTSSESYTIGTPNYTFKSGIQTSTISITTTKSKSSSLSTTITDTNADTSSSATVLQPIPAEDLAAVCVQCIQSLDWTKSRIINVSKRLQQSEESVTSPTIPKSSLRPDQEWCVNSYILRNILATIE